MDDSDPFDRLRDRAPADSDSPSIWGRGAARGLIPVSETDNYFSPAIEELSKVDPEDIQRLGPALLKLSMKYYTIVLVHAARSFRAAIVSAAVGLMFFIAAVSIFLVRNDIRAGTVSAIGGAIVEVIAGLNFWLYGRTTSQMNFFHIRLEQTQKYLLANSLTTKLEKDKRETVLTELIREVFSAPVFNPKEDRDGT